jgi:hypothetical protein
VPGDDEEARRLAPHALVLVDGDRDRLFALPAAAFAEELGATLDVEGLVQFRDPLIDLTEEGFVSALAFCTCGHEPGGGKNQVNTLQKCLLEA